MKNFFKIPNSTNVHPDVAKNLKHNFFTNILDAGFWFFGDSFVAAYTILPVYMSTFTDSPLLIGLIPALEGAGWFLPQLFLAKYLEGKNRRKPIVMKLGFLDRFPLLLLAIGAFFIPNLNTNTAIILFFVIYIIKAFSAGLVALPWQELMATVIPVSHRGRYWGLSLVLGKLTGLIGATITAFVLTNYEYPQNYSFIFFIGFIAASISFIFLGRNIEPEIERPENLDNIKMWGKVKKILKVDTNFRIFLINRGFLFLAMMSLGFIAVYGIQQFDLPVSYSAIFTIVMFGSEIIGFGIWGTIGDKIGYKRVLEIGNFILIISLISLLFVDTITGLLISFGLTSLAHSGEYLADQNIAMEFGDEENRPTYIGMSKTLTGPVILAAPLIGGLIINSFGYKSMFITSLVISVISFVLIKFFVKEPRNN